VISKSAILSASIGLALSALLTGSLRVAGPAKTNTELEQLKVQGKKLYAEGSYYDARAIFMRASRRARVLGLPQAVSMNLVRSGVCLYRALNFREAQKELEQARELARSAGDLPALAASENNLANLYLHIGEQEKALQITRAALAGPEAWAEQPNHGRLLFQEATALAETDRFPEAEPFYKGAIEELTDYNDLASAASIEGAYGAELLKASRIPEAEDVLSHALWLVRIHHLNASANILSSLAELKDRQGDTRSATNLFEAALSAAPNISPVWQIRSRRGQFLLNHADLPGALSDFRQARRAALEMRADMMPADQDRVALESEARLGAVIEGLVEAGNRLARTTGDRAALRETFDAAEQDRMWSLRELVPTPNDWRSRLPNHYWELLSRYQALQRTAVAGRTAEAAHQIARLQLELGSIEAADSSDRRPDALPSESALEHAQSVLDDDSVLFSFLITKTSAWVWAVDRGNVDVWPLPAPARIEAEAKALIAALRRGNIGTPVAADLYRDLFGSIPKKYRKHRRWLIEPDGPLNGVPFAALVTSPGRFLVEQAAVESIPGALLLERYSIPSNAPFLAIGDPIYNSADPRYRARSTKPDLMLPRLPNTEGEVASCARAWGDSDSKLLTGPDATAGGVQAAIGRNAGIVHFATHVVTEPGEFRSGLIALSLDASGGMGLLGPKEIVARPVASALIVMNGCHSAQGKPLSNTGLMGLTRAWIGAGAKAVIATGWDVPDALAQSLMSDFYRALHASPERGAAFALREAQLKAIQNDRGGGSQWAAYSLLSRLL
jgi:CHAT domain-containing protein/tetratricopeptide (TPR) repeat protein